MRNALPDFDDFIDEHELAGLAMEAEFDSRIIRKQQEEWAIFQGPFDDFNAATGYWTLLVQGVDKYVDEASELMARFNFIPNWRVDDLMISYAVPGAGVGPHVDQYDVFLLQGQGCRRWRVGQPDKLTSVQPVAGLCQVEDFDPVIDCELNPGDILYIPPGWPHDGVALADSLTYSVGFRAPDQSQLSTYLAEHLQANPALSKRYGDPTLSSNSTPAVVTSEQLQALKALLHDAIDSAEFSETLLTLLSDQGLEPEASDEIDHAFLQHHLDNGGFLIKSPGCRPLLNPELAGHLFINGESLQINPCNHDLYAKLLSQTEIDRTDMESAADQLDIFCTFTTLVKMGYWEVSPE